jgi:transposase
MADCIGRSRRRSSQTTGYECVKAKRASKAFDTAIPYLYAHDPTTLFADIALRARRAFGLSARQVHVDITSFAVTGEYATDLDAHTIAVTYGYSRDHRADLK